MGALLVLAELDAALVVVDVVMPDAEADQVRNVEVQVEVVETHLREVADEDAHPTHLILAELRRRRPAGQRQRQQRSEDHRSLQPFFHSLIPP